MLEGLSPLHLILILAIALIVLGPGKLPEAGAALGKAIRGFRDAAAGKNDALPKDEAAPGQEKPVSTDEHAGTEESPPSR